MKYIVTITMSDGNEIRAKINGINPDDAIKNLKHNDKVQQFINEQCAPEAFIQNIDAAPLQPRYDYRAYSDGSCVCTDTRFGYRVQWQRGQYDTTAEASRITDEEQAKFGLREEDDLSELQIATVMREMGEWIATFHYADTNNAISPRQQAVALIHQAMERADMDEEDLSGALGVKLNRIHRKLSGESPITAEQLISTIRVLGGELKLVFPDD